MKKILVVDDSYTSVRLFMALLEGPDYDVRVASNGIEALQAYADSKPDVVILDLNLPEMSGFDVARRLKQDRGMHGIRILAITAYERGYAEAEALSAGVDRFMTKPFSGVALRDTIAEMVST